ncbi:hypothetical protein APHNP_0281 [Anaplasma phagocytophilum str. ApNP]|uniref:Uncharacterized protein n=1 Tax=Anaplasma phagocytophilum str. ApNP TaxID=1359153 RepID=A0A0F3NIQ5_ANAPH|nr:hypothetical protein APHNP_0281 [Anaplasma phagocytophilum str. ApNP]
MYRSNAMYTKTGNLLTKSKFYFTTSRIIVPSLYKIIGI